MRIWTVEKTPGATLPIFLSWAAWVKGERDQLELPVAITSSVWTGPGGIELLTSPPEILSGTRTGVWISGGTLGGRYEITNTIETDQGHVGIARSILVIVVP